jgi:hypothetical protein
MANRKPRRGAERTLFTCSASIARCRPGSSGSRWRASLSKWADAFRRLTDLWWNRELVSSAADRPQRLCALRLALDELQSLDGIAGLYLANFAYDLARAWRPTNIGRQC